MTQDTVNVASSASQAENTLGMATAQTHSPEEKIAEISAETLRIDHSETIKASKYEEIVPGMVVKVYQKIKDVTSKGTERERVQVFEGTVLSRSHGKGVNATITVRKISHGVGVEKIYPLHSPTITKIEVLRKLKVHRAKLYFLSRGYKKRMKEEKVV
jgi:large subunit ribosomal protein L19